MKNLKIRYYLEATSKDLEARIKKELVMASINYGYSELDKKGNKQYKPTRFSLQVNILPNRFGLKEYNFKFDEIVFKNMNKNDASVRTKMLQLETALIEIATEHISAVTLPTSTELIAELSSRMRVKKVVEAKISILDFLYSKIKTDTENINKSKKRSKTANTIKTYITVSHLIENYQIATNEILSFANFNEKSYWKFWDVLDDILSNKIIVFNPKQPKRQRKQSYGYLVSTLRKYQISLLASLRQAKKEGHITPLDVNDSELILQNVKAAKIFYLESDLLKSVLESDVSTNYELQNAKDYLIIASLTGMRFESMKDAENTTITSFKDNKYDFKYIHSIHNKTTTEVFIPLLKPVCDIINQRGFPKIPVNSVINENLKKLLKYLNVEPTTKVKLVTYSNGTIETTEPISGLMRTHDCKGNFYSNLRALQISKSVIDSITHPDRPPENAMGKIYDKTDMLTIAKEFVDVVNKVESDVYTF